MVAFKRLQARDANEVERARREAEALGRLWHPAIVRHVADGTTDDGALYIVMSWVEGVNVADRLVREGFSLREAVAMVVRIAGALRHRARGRRAPSRHRQAVERAARRATIPRARCSSTSASLAHAGRGARADPDRRRDRHRPATCRPSRGARQRRTSASPADVFGLGCLLYECATTKPAYSGTNASAVIAKVLFGEPPPFQAHSAPRPRPSSRIDLVARRCSRRTRRDRFAGAAPRRRGGARGPGRARCPSGARAATRARRSPTPTKVSRQPGEVHCIVVPRRAATPTISSSCARAGLVLVKRSTRLATRPRREPRGHGHRRRGRPPLIGDARAVAVSRAATIAPSELRKAILPGWSVVISSVRIPIPRCRGGQRAPQLLASAAMNAIFKKRGEQDHGGCEAHGDAPDRRVRARAGRPR